MKEPLKDTYAIVQHFADCRTAAVRIGDSVHLCHNAAELWNLVTRQQAPARRCASRPQPRDFETVPQYLSNGGTITKHEPIYNPTKYEAKEKARLRREREAVAKVADKKAFAKALAFLDGLDLSK